MSNHVRAGLQPALHPSKPYNQSKPPPAIDYNGRRLEYGTGCDRAPDCFTCPLPDCKSDNHYPTQHSAIQRAQALDLQSQGACVTEIANKLQASKRQVYRYLHIEA